MLSQKFEQFSPQVIAFNGKGTYENFAQRPCKLGLQKGRIYGAQVFVLPSTSATATSSGHGPKLRYFRQLAKVLAKLKKLERDAGIAEPKLFVIPSLPAAGSTKPGIPRQRIAGKGAMPETMAKAKIKFLHKPNCTTCRKAKAFLDKRKVELEFRDLGKDRLTVAELDQLIGRPRPSQVSQHSGNELYRERKIGRESSVIAATKR